MQKVQIIFLVALSLLGTLSRCNGECVNTAMTTDCKADYSSVLTCSAGTVVGVQTVCVSPQVCSVVSGTATCVTISTAPTAPPTAPTVAATTVATTTVATTTVATTTAATTTAATSTVASSTTVSTTTVAGTTTAPIPVSIQCSGTGFFPDPFNCRYFHDCRSGPMSILYVCNAGYVYYAPGNKCLLKTSDSDCITINCAGYTGLYRPYYPYSYYYTKCGSVPTSIYRCGSTSQYFSTATNTCVT